MKTNFYEVRYEPVENRKNGKYRSCIKTGRTGRHPLGSTGLPFAPVFRAKWNVPHRRIHGHIVLAAPGSLAAVIPHAHDTGMRL